MQFDLQSNISEVVEALKRKAKEVPLAAKKGLVDATTTFYAESLDQLASLIYNRPIPLIKRWRRLKNKNGSWRSAANVKKKQKSFFGFAHSSKQSEKRAWKRTSTLRRNERAYFDRLASFETSVDNATPYANARHELNRPSRFGYDNQAPWRQKAFEQKKDAAEAKLRDALAVALEK